MDWTLVINSLVEAAPYAGFSILFIIILCILLNGVRKDKNESIKAIRELYNETRTMIITEKDRTISDLRAEIKDLRKDSKK